MGAHAQRKDLGWNRPAFGAGAIRLRPLRLRAGSSPEYRGTRCFDGRGVYAVQGGRNACAQGLQSRLLVLQRGPNEGGEQRMRFERLGLEFRMELAAEEPGMLGGFDDLDVVLVGRAPGNLESGRNQGLFMLAVEFIAVAVPLADLELAVGLGCKRTRLELAGPGSQAHGAAHFVDAQQFAQ